jgi:DNA-binding CsgD family transcriptional regulator
MIRTDEEWLATVDAFESAATGVRPWEKALQRLAHITGSQSGQLLGVRSDCSVRFSILSDGDHGNGHGNTHANGYLNGNGNGAERHAATSYFAPALGLWDKPAHATREKCRRDPLYQQVLNAGDRPFIFLKTLDTLDGTTIGLVAARSARDEQITNEQRQVFAALVPHARAAVRMQMALERNASEVVAAALEALEIPAFIVDDTGRVSASTRPVTALLAGTYGLLTLESGHLKFARATDAKAVADAVDAVTVGANSPSSPALHTVIVRGADHKALPLVLDVCALPYPASQLQFAPRALIASRGTRVSDARHAVILRDLYALTAAEANIAEQLAAGRMPQVIAKHRGVAVGTVRAQIKTIMAKVGVRRQIELSARLRQI